MPGGVGDYTRRLGEAIVARGHHACALTVRDRHFWVVEPSGRPGDRAARLVSSSSGWAWGCWRDVIAALDSVRPHVLHIQYQTGAYGMHPAINLLPWRLSQLPGRPAIVVTAHDLLLPYLFPKAGPLRTWVTSRLLADSDAVVVTNEEDYARVAGLTAHHAPRRAPSLLTATGGRIGRLDLIPIGSNIPVAPPPSYDRDMWRAGLGVGEGEILVVYFGLLSRSKGVETLLRALDLLPASLRVAIIGGEATAPQDRAYATEVRARLAATGLRERVRLTGHCSESEVSAHLLAADIAALPYADGASFRRGSLLAALAHGVPVITTASDRRPTADLPTVLRPLVDGESALLVQPADAEALAEAIVRLAGDPALRDRLGVAGRELAAQFSWEEIAARHEELYESLTDHR